MCLPVRATDIFNNFIELYGNVRYVFLDEIQNLNRWELFVNNLQRNYNVFITGKITAIMRWILSSKKALTLKH